MARDRDARPPPERVGQYAIGELLGSGGAGSVYRATGDDGSLVAIKLFDAHLKRPTTMRRFRTEASIRIDHPNVVTVLDAGTAEDGTPFIVLEFLEGRPFSDIVSERRLTALEAVDLGISICAGLSAAHDAGVIHRDLKPENVFICKDGTVKILDFGIALLDTDPERITNTGLIIGTPWYLSPEQASGSSDLDRRTDLWSVGALLYEALSGETPFEFEGMLQTVLAILRDELTPLRVVAPFVPRPLAVVIERCLVKDRRFRWSSADAIGLALSDLDLDDADGAGAITAPVTRPSIAIGERRLVAVLFAEGVEDEAALQGAVEERGGQYLPLYAKRAVGLFGGEAWEGDELSRAVEAGLAARSAARRVSVVAGHAMGHGAGISGEALAAAEQGAKTQRAGVVLDERSAKLLDEGYRAIPLGNGLLEVTASRRPTPIAPMNISGASVLRDSAFPPGPGGAWSPPLAGGFRDSLVPLAPAPPFVGRAMEVAQIDQAVREVLEERRAAAVLIVGPTGIGKSRLREEMQLRLAEHQSAVTVLFARGDTLGSTSAFSLLGAALRRHARIIAAPGGARIDAEAPSDERREAVRQLAESGLSDALLVEETAPFLGEILGVDFPDAPDLAAARSDPQVMAERIRLAVRDFFAGLASRGPLALTLEDVQWADEATLDVVEELVDYLADMPFLAFLTARPWIDEARQGYLEAQGVLRIEPRPLLEADVVQLTTAIAKRPFSPNLLRRIHERCGGNPLFIEQMVAELLSRDFFDEDSVELLLPLTVEAAVQSRLDHLPDLERALCRYAAVLSRPFSVKELEMLGVADAAILLDSLARRGIVVARAASRVGKGREYRFRVAIVGEVAYSMLARDQLSELHRRTADVLEHLGEVGAEELAVHYEKGGEARRAADNYAKAALAAGRKGDVKSVVRCSEKALAYGVKNTVRFELRMSRANALHFQGLIPEALEDLDDAMGCVADGAQRARVHSERGWLYFLSGKLEESLDELAWAVALGEQGDAPEIVTRALLRRASVRVGRGELDDAASDVEEAGQGVADGSPLGAWVAEFRAYLCNAHGDFSAAQLLVQEAIELFEKSGDVQRSVRARANLADLLNSICAFGDAEQALRRAVQDCRRVGNRLSEGWATVNLGRALVGLNRSAEAQLLIADAIEIGRDAPHAPLQAVGLLWEGWAHLVSGDPQRAGISANRASAFAAANGLMTQEAGALALLASAHVEMHEGKAALAAATRGMEILNAMGALNEGEAELLLAYGRALVQNGSASKAEQVWARGRQLVAKQAMRISNEQERDRFLGAPAHRALLEAN